jgi:hypothetical protein
MTVLDSRLDAVGRRAEEIRVGRILALIVGALFFGLGWLVARVVSGLWTGLRWALAAATLGWEQGWVSRGSARTD